MNIASLQCVRHPSRGPIVARPLDIAAPFCTTTYRRQAPLDPLEQLDQLLTNDPVDTRERVRASLIDDPVKAHP
jgi:hypothetical protein